MMMSSLIKWDRGINRAFSQLTTINNNKNTETSNITIKMMYLFVYSVTGLQPKKKKEQWSELL